MKRLRAALIAALMILPVSAAAQTFPRLTGRVVDGANILSPQTEASLTQKLAGLEANSRVQLVVATVPSLQGYTIEDYGYRLGRAWGIGRADEDDGAILLVAPNERDVRVEVGYGLGGRLTDLMSGVILRQAVLPRFRQGDLEGGVVAGTDALVSHLSLPPDQARARVAATEDRERTAAAEPDGGFGFILLLLLFFFFILPLLTRRGRRRRRRGMGGLAEALIWSAATSGWSGGGRGGRWGGGGGGGGFRGGGGSFGGGGASGSW